jgi:hypothetical protein
MNAQRHPDRLIQAFLMEGQTELADQVYDAVRATIEPRQQRVVIGRWRMADTMNKFVSLGLGAAAVVVALVIGSQLLGPTAPGGVGGGPSANPSPTPTPTLTAEPSSAADDVLNGFLEARVAGAGAQQYLNEPEEDIPLLYATTSGAPNERAEFERVLGIEWPYGLTAFKVRLFAGDTVVEQLFFTPPDGRLGLGYQSDGFGTHIAPTTEDGKPLAVPYSFPDGEVTLHAAHPWVFHDGSRVISLIPEGPSLRPTTDGGERRDWDALALIANPAPVGTGCQAGRGPADAEALAESIRSDPDLEATAPVAVSAGGAEALMMDVLIAAGASVCGGEGVAGLDGDPGVLVVADIGLATGDRMRLYLFDVPVGSSMRTLAIAINAPESRFESVVEAAAPVVDSVEFHAP